MAVTVAVVLAGCGGGEWVVAALGGAWCVCVRVEGGGWGGGGVGEDGDEV